jgi:hypothetical protein
MIRRTAVTAVTVWSASIPADPVAGIHHLVTLVAPDSSDPGPVVGRITRHPDFGDTLSARLYPTLSTTMHTPLGVGYTTLQAAAHAIAIAFDDARLLSLTTATDLTGAEPVTLIRFDGPCMQPRSFVHGHVAIGDHLRCVPCGTDHVLTRAVRTHSVPVHEMPADTGR